jgi:hypothetical protein
MSEKLWRVIGSVLFAIACGGWAIPLCVAVIVLADGSQALASGEQIHNSFPHFHFARQAAVMAAVWAFLGLGVWIASGIRRSLR